MAPTAWIVVAPNSDTERVVPVQGRLFVGRECAGIADEHRLLIEDPGVSREHLEVRVDAAGGAVLVDHSSNGTRLNGRRVERGEPHALHDGDLVELGALELEVRLPVALGAVPNRARATEQTLGAHRVAVVVGQLVDQPALLEEHGARAVLLATERLVSLLRELLAAHRGTASSSTHASFFSIWDADRDDRAPNSAVAFALGASELVQLQARSLDVRGPDGRPLEMAWGVAAGEAAIAHPSPGSELVHGDAVALAYQLAAVAGRDGRGAVLVSEAAAEAAPLSAAYGAAQSMPIAGRRAPVCFHTAARRPAVS